MGGPVELPANGDPHTHWLAAVAAAAGGAAAGGGARKGTRIGCHDRFYPRPDVFVFFRAEVTMLHHQRANMLPLTLARHVWSVEYLGDRCPVDGGLARAATGSSLVGVIGMSDHELL